MTRLSIRPRMEYKDVKNQKTSDLSLEEIIKISKIFLLN